MIDAKYYNHRIGILLVNGAAIVVLTICMLYVASGVPMRASPTVPLLYWIALFMLVSGEWFAWKNKYIAATVAMFLGGIVTIPVGLLAIIGSISARRLWTKLNAQDAMKDLCANCSYDLRGTPVPRCSECGCLRGFDKTPEELIPSYEPPSAEDCDG